MLITIWPIPILHPSPRLTSRCQRYLQISNVRMPITKFWVLTKYTNGLVIARNAFGLVLRKVQNYANRCKRSDNSVKYVIMHWWKSDDCTMNVSWGENQSHLFFSRPFPPVRLPLVTHLMQTHMIGFHPERDSDPKSAQGVHESRHMVGDPTVPGEACSCETPVKKSPVSLLQE